MRDEFQVGDWLVRADTGTVSKGEVQVQLEPKVMSVLVYLAEHAGDVLPKERLLQAVWPDTFVTDDVLRRAISELRKAFGDDTQDPRYIRTLPRRGFQLVAEVDFPEEEEESTERFQVLQPLGRGAMAEVHLAQDTSLGRKVALKFLLPEMEEEASWARRLRREARAGAALDHPFICKVYDTGKLEGRSFIAMEYIEGETLKEHLKQGPLPVKEALRIALEMAEALEVAHRHGIIHRDIKPSNIILTDQGHVKITDFGIAKRLPTSADDKQEFTDTLTIEASTLGTIPYMSPEQVKGQPLDQRSDLFSFGVVFYQMLTGLNPFYRPVQAETIGAVLHHDPEPLSEENPEAAKLEHSLAKLLAKDPDDRYQSASDVIAALQELPEKAPAEIRPYPGLASFTAEQVDYFFGREIETEQLWEKIRRSSLLGLIGPTGSGKSSFIRAGLVPAAPEGWAVVVATPGSRPFMGLAEALSGQLVQDPDALRQLFRFEDEEVAVSVVSAWRRKHADAVIVVDQFEELFTLNPEEEQRRFSEFLGRLIEEREAHLLLSMRDDFLFRCHGFERLEGVFADLTPIGPLTGNALKRALVEPANRCGYEFEDQSLVERILEEIEGERGALPLLAFAASQMWDRRDQEKKLLTEKSYEVIGGVAGALSLHAETTLEEIGKESIPIVRELFRNLVTAEGTRAVQDRQELVTVFEEDRRAEAERVLGILLDARLLVAYGPSADEDNENEDQRVEIVHESLLTNWPRLVRWQSQDSEGAKLRDELRQAARTWDQHERSEDLLWTGTAFKEYEVWQERYPGGLTDLEEAFGNGMESHSRRRSRRRRLLVAAAILLAVIIALILGLLLQSAADEARYAKAIELLKSAQDNVEPHPTAAVAYATKSLELADNRVARRLVAEVLSQGPIAFTRPTRSHALDSRFSPDGQLFSVAGWSGLLELWHQSGSKPVELSAFGEDSRTFTRFSENSRFLISWDDRGSMKDEVRSWRLPDMTEARSLKMDPRKKGYFHHLEGQAICTYIESSPHIRIEVLPWQGGAAKQLGTWSWPPKDKNFIGFTRDGTPSMVSVRDRDLYILDGYPSDNAVPRHLGKLAASFQQLQFLPDGKHVATRDEEYTMTIWPLEPTVDTPFRVVRDDTAFMNSWVWDEDGTWMGKATARGTAYVWDLTAPAGSEPLYLRRGSNNIAFSLALHPDGEWVATGDGEGRGMVALWPLKHTYPRVIWRHPEKQWLTGVVVDPNGEWVAASSWDGRLLLWSLSTTGTGDPKVLYEGTLLSSCAVSPDGELIAVCQHRTGTIVVVPVAGGPVRILEGFRGPAASIAFNPTGTKLAVAGSSGLAEDLVIRVWDLETGKVQVLDSGDRTGIFYLSFAADDLLRSCHHDGLRVWDLTTGSFDVLLPNVRGQISPDGRYYAGANLSEGAPTTGDMTVIDLETGETWDLPSYGDSIMGFLWHPSGRAILTGTTESVIRVGSITGEPPHLLFGHAGALRGVSFDPTGKWIFSASNDGTLRMWAMPDLSKPPIQSLPHDGLLEKLYSLTNLRVVEDEESATGYEFELDEFPGWEEVPDW